MKTEMDLLGMDARRRMAWLLANRTTLMIVGLVWLGMIGAELGAGRTPVFLMVMVPVIAAIRAGLYFLYARRVPATS